jgi:hypothetical protein
MRALVVFESMFGNTEAVARAVAEGLESRFDVEVAEVGHAPPAVPDDVDFLVAGAPTHAFGLSRRSTRENAAHQAHAAVVSQSIGLREWLAGLPERPGALAAVFDTRIDRPRLPGSAAAAATRRLRKLGYRVVVASVASFYVTEVEGPLVQGQVERARAWGERLAAAAAAGNPPRVTR